MYYNFKKKKFKMLNLLNYRSRNKNFNIIISKKKYSFSKYYVLNNGYRVRKLKS